MLFRNRGLDPNRQNLRGKFSFEENLGVSNEEKRAITEAYDDDYTVLEGDSGDLGGIHVVDQDALIEALLYQEITMMPDAERTNFLNSDQFSALIEAGLIGRRALLEGIDVSTVEGEFARVWHLIAMQIAKESNDANFEALRKLRVKEKALKKRIYEKYGPRAKQEARKQLPRLKKLTMQAQKVGNEAKRKLAQMDAMNPQAKTISKSVPTGIDLR